MLAVRLPSPAGSGPSKTLFLCDHVTVQAASCCTATDKCVMRAGFWKGAGMTACNSQATTSQVPSLQPARAGHFFFFFFLRPPSLQCQASLFGLFFAPCSGVLGGDDLLTGEM